MIEGAVVDIIPEELPAGFISGSIILAPAATDTLLISVTIQNLTEDYLLELEPDISGTANYMVQVPIGSYSVTACYPDYEFIAYDNIIVEEFQITTVDFILEQVLAPTELSGVLAGNQVTLNWTHAAGRAFQYYNIYRNINATAFTLLDTTGNLNYIDQITLPHNLTYGYHITAVYSQENESHSSNNVFIEYNVPNKANVIDFVSHAGNYPNPFNPATTIFFNLQQDSEIELGIYNTKGQHIITLAKSKFTKGDHSLTWNGEDENQQPVSSGIYFYKLQAGKITTTKRMVLLK